MLVTGYVDCLFLLLFSDKSFISYVVNVCVLQMEGKSCLGIRIIAREAIIVIGA